MKKAIALTVVSILIIVLSPLYFYKILTAKQQEKSASYGTVIKLWHIDNFEGGRGSRADFLAARAAEFEKKNSGIYILITVHTKESAALCFESGIYPDAISYGTGFSDAAETAYPMTSLEFAAAKISGKTYAYPWCYGGYGIFSLKGEIDRSNIKGKIVLNRAGGAAAAALEGINIENFVIDDGTCAYVDFLNGKYDYLIGTQRDIARFETRGVQVYFSPFDSFSDLFQYITIMTNDSAKSTIARAYINHLLSANSQKKLTAIYMLSHTHSIYDSQSPHLFELEKVRPKTTLPAFTASKYLQEFYESAILAVKGNEQSLNILKNFAVNI